MSIPNESLLVKISGDVSNLKAQLSVAESSIKKLRKEAGDAEGKISNLGKVGSNIAGMFAGKAKDTGLGSFIGEIGEGTTALSAFAGPATVAAGAIVGIGTAAVGAGKMLFDMAKSASDYSGDISDASQKTGLAIDTISSMKFAGDAFGASFEEMTGATTKFTKLVGEAAKGSDEAAKTLKALGVDPKKAVNDLDGALSQAMKRIYELPPGAQQANAAIAAFGKSGANVIPVLNAFEGDLDALKKRAKELGLVLTNDAIKAGDDFGDTYAIVAAQAKATAAAFALEFAPEITKAMDSVSKYLANNKNDWKKWGDGVGDIIRGVKLAAIELGEFKAVQQLQNEGFGRTFFGPLYALGDIARPFAEAGAESRNKEEVTNALNSVKWTDSYRTKVEAKKPTAAGDADSGFLANAATAKKEKKKELTEAQKTTWNSSTLAEFTRNQGFKPGDGFAKTGHNKGSLHGLNRALDVGLNASNQGKTVNQIVQYMENAIKAGIRVVDERVRPKGQKKWSAAHLHLEENDKRASSFNPNLDYGGRLEYLKALDAERLKGKGQSIADALGTVKKDEISEGERALADLNKQIALLGVTTEKGRAEIETSIGSLSKLTEKEKESYIAAAARKDSFEVQAKATADYNEYLAKLYEQYDDLNGIEKTATGDLLKYIAAVRSSGQAIDKYTALNHLGVAAMNDLQPASAKLADASAEMTDRYKAERDAAWDLIAARISLRNEIARETGQREEKTGGISDDVDWSPYIADMNADAGAAAPKFNDKYKLGDFTDGLLGGRGNNLAQFESEAEAMKAVYNDLENTAGAALGSMIEGGAQLLEQWIMTGEMSGQAIAQMTASIIAGVAAQAGVKAIFEVAEGLAAAANPFTAWQAPIHFAAAKTYGLVALGAAAVGAGIGAMGGLGGKKDKKGSSNDSTQNPSDYFSGNNSDDRRINYLRQSQSGSSAYQQSNSRLEEKISVLSESVDGLKSHIGSMNPSDVLRNGIKGSPGMITETVNKELAKNSTMASQMGRRLPAR